ncbi:hypothetical protein CJ430_31085, partial [Klebsiella pneumoniae]
PADIQPNARILLSAAINGYGQLMFITDTVQTVTNRRHLTLRCLTTRQIFNRTLAFC